MKMYSLKYAENCYPLTHFKDGDVIQEMKRDVGEGFFYCKMFMEVGDSTEGVCGASCAEYKPRNGVSGICKYHRNTYSGTGNFFIKYGKKLKRVIE